MEELVGAFIGVMIAIAMAALQLVMHLLVWTGLASYAASRSTGTSRLSYLAAAAVGLFLLFSVLRLVVPSLYSPGVDWFFTMPVFLIALAVFFVLIMLPSAVDAQVARDTAETKPDDEQGGTPPAPSAHPLHENAVFAAYAIVATLVFGVATIWTSTTQREPARERYCARIFAELEQASPVDAAGLLDRLDDLTGNRISEKSPCELPSVDE